MLNHFLNKLKIICFFVVYFIAYTAAFNVYWNVPSQTCKRHSGINLAPLLSQYGILVNENDTFHGGNITIFYESQLGLYPRISESGDFENGGIHQLGDLAEHIDVATRDAERIIPDENFDGLGVIDWEAWRPVWNFNFGNLKIYQEMSKEYVKERNPDLNKASVNNIASKEWEASAKSYMRETIQLMKNLRPHARWCYYLFPDCYNWKGETLEDFECSINTKEGNDKLDWLWEVSTAICPSMYVYESHLQRYSFEQRKWKDHGKLKEALRVASPKAKIYPYVNYYLAGEMASMKELERIFGQIAAAGSDGLVIWSSSASVSNDQLCQKLKRYITETLGPLSKRIQKSSKKCSSEICYGRGKCTWPTDNSVTAWAKFIRTNASFDARGVVCRCKEKFGGQFCENQVSL